MIVELSNFKHLNYGWTVQDLIGMTKSAIRQYELQSEYEVPINLIRKTYNMALHTVQNLILVDCAESYAVTAKATIDLNNPIGNLFEIDLDTVDIIGEFMWGTRTFTKDTFDLASSILRTETLYNEFLGTYVYKTPEELISLNTGENKLFNQSFLWTRAGNKILVYMGAQALADYTALPTDNQYLKLKFIRMAVPDDLKRPFETRVKLVDLRQAPYNYPTDVNLYSETYYESIDIPNKYSQLVILEMKKQTFEALSQPIPEALETKIQGIIQSIQAGMQNDITKDKLKEEKEN